MFDLFAPTEAREIVLRDYQAAAIDGLRESIRAGSKRLLLVAGTGAGKTLTAAHLIKEAARKGSYTLFVVDRVSLVNQTSAVFDEYGIPHGIIQGGNERWAPREHVQVCSAQTLARRGLPRDPNLIIVDEAHCHYKGTLDLMEMNPQAVKIGLTATPFTPGMAEHWDGVVNVIPTRRLIEQGHLTEPTIFVARSPEDSEFGLNSYGEFSDSSATDAGIKIVGDVVAEWVAKTQEHLGGPAKTIVFTPTVEHGRELCAAFHSAGYNFQQISHLDRDDEDRAAKIEEFRKRDSEIVGLVSCGVLTKGFDVPDVAVGISCKPYRKSLSSHMQEIGRVMRTHPDVPKKLWLDHSGNIERFALDMYDVWEHGVGELSHATKRNSQPRTRDEQTKKQVVCPKCSGALRGPTCTACGWERPANSGINAVEGELHEFKLPDAMQPREGLRSECLNNPRGVYEAALSYALANGRDQGKSRKRAYAIWKGIYPNSKPGFGWFEMQRPRAVDEKAASLIEREVQRFRKQSKRRASA